VTFLSFCVKCGHKLPEDASFCSNCGVPVAKKVAAKLNTVVEEPSICPQIMNDSSKIEEFIQDLKDSWRPKEERMRAAEELGEIGDSRAVETLINTLKARASAAYDLRKKTAVALGKIGDKRAVEPLIEVMREDEVLVSVEAAKALGEIGGDRAVEALVKTLKEDDRCWEPSEYLQPYQDTVWVAVEAARALGKIGEPAVKPLIEALEETGWSAWGGTPYGHAAEVLAEIGGVRAVEPLVKALGQGSSWTDRDMVVRALVKVGGARAVKPLITALKDPNALTRQGAAEALGLIGDARAVKPLIEALEEEEYVQRDAARALNRIGGEEAEKALERIRISGKLPFRFLEGLNVEKMEKNRDVRGLINVLAHKDSTVRQKAAWALSELGWEPKDDAEKVRYLIAWEKWNEVAELGEVAVEPLIQNLKNELSRIRSGAASALGMIGDARGIEPLKQALKDKNEEVQGSAYEALRKMEV